MISLSPTPESGTACARVLDLASAGKSPSEAARELGIPCRTGATWGQVALDYGFHLERLAACRGGTGISPEAMNAAEKNEPRKVRASGAGAII